MGYARGLPFHCYTLNAITDLLLAISTLSLNSKHEKYWDNFDTMVKFLTLPVLHEEVHQCLDIASIGKGAKKTLKKYDKGHRFENLLFSKSPRNGPSYLLLRRSLEIIMCWEVVLNVALTIP